MSWERLIKRVFDIDVERCACGGMITEVSSLAEVSEKHLEFLLAAEPHVKRVGFLVDPPPNLEWIRMDPSSVVA